MKRYMDIRGQETDDFFGGFQIQCSYFHVVEETDEWIGYTHCHRAFELAYVLSGEGEYFLNGEQIPLETGDLVITPPLTDHMEKGEPGSSFSILFLNVTHTGESAEKIDALLGDKTRKFNMKDKKAKAIFSNLVYEMYMQQTGYYTMVQQYLKELYVQLFRIQNREEKPEPPETIRRYQRNPAAEIVSRIHEYVSIHLAEKIDIEEMAKHFFYHPKYLHAVVKKQTGETLANYVMSIKMEEACKLLKNSELSINEIADMTGFSSIPYFYRCFGDRMELTPSQYRISQNSAEEQPYHE